MMELVSEVMTSSLKSRVPTRWSSNYELAKSVARFPWDTDGSIFKSNSRLDLDEVDLLREFITVVSPLDQIMKMVQDLQYPSIARCVPGVLLLKRHLAVRSGSSKYLLNLSDRQIYIQIVYSYSFCRESW